VSTKQQLLEGLRASGAEVLEQVRSASAEDLEGGRYENGWNARQILAHVASIEWTYPRLVDLARGAAAPTQPTPAVRVTNSPQDAPEVPTRPPRTNILDYNDRQVEKRASASIDELLQEFEQNRAATIAAVESADDDLFEREIRSAGGITGSLSGVIDAVAVQHVRAHLRDILRSPA
jgi:hypothetical protein